MNSSATSNNTITAKIKNVSAALYDDVIGSQKLIAFGIVASVVASIVFITVLRWLVKPIVWCSLFGCAAVLVYCEFVSQTLSH
jgi:hypothetical protein